MSPTNPIPPALPAPPSGELQEQDFIVRVHPDGGLYVGDRVSLEVIALEPADLVGQVVDVEVVEEQGEIGLQAQFGHYGIGGRLQATLTWSWNTSGLAPGDYDVSISIPSRDFSWIETFTLLPAEQVPPPEPQASWAVSETDCCLVHHITGTAADRDLKALLEMVDERTKNAARLMGIESDGPLEITFLPRVLGHGGFAGPEISVSYLDRNYATSNPEVVLHHEIVHELDSRLGGEMRPSLLSEGLAVYLTGGHFKPEPLTPRAAALLPPLPGCIQAQEVLAGRTPASQDGVCGLNWYLPLIPLMDNFYLSQHEVGYLQAASLIEFMVDSWGWEAFDAFYRNIHSNQTPLAVTSETPAFSSGNPGETGISLGSQAAAVNTALVAHFGITIQQLESQYLAALQEETLHPELVEDVRLSVGFFETVRRYQQLLDPSAYFLTAWLPDGKMMREQGLVADYLRRPSTPQNLTLEVMLVAADEAIQNGEFASVERILQSINTVLDSVQEESGRAFLKDNLAARYHAVVSLLLAQGYQPHKVSLENDQAQAWVSTSGPDLELIIMEDFTGGWAIKESTQIPAPP
ncbi:MAG: hypothetical protein A2Z16_01610 [Chloroflexi bacterium RBG_16_54_18]|nr:MAG: hypothetical protein A2Z16_01610 [Chloroflexi bacterium RBG_16_54_18]